MELTTHGIWTMVHGMGFGALYLLSCSFAIVELSRRYRPRSLQPISQRTRRFSACGWLRWRWLRGSLYSRVHT